MRALKLRVTSVMSFKDKKQRTFSPQEGISQQYQRPMRQWHVHCHQLQLTILIAVGIVRAIQLQQKIRLLTAATNGAVVRAGHQWVFYRAVCWGVRTLGVHRILCLYWLFIERWKLTNHHLQNGPTRAQNQFYIYINYVYYLVISFHIQFFLNFKPAPQAHKT